MNNDNSFIVIYRKMMNWEWYKDKNTLKLFIHCLIKANWKSSKFQGINISIGSFVSSLSNLSKETGLSIQEVRTSLKHLISTGELTDKVYSKFRVITINNYDKYQISNRVTNSHLTVNQQATNRVKLKISTGYLTVISTSKFVEIKGKINFTSSLLNTMSNIQLTKSIRVNLTPIEEIINSSCSSYKEEITRAHVYKYFEENIYTIDSLTKEELDKWLKVFNEDLIKYAIKIAVLKNKKNMHYIVGILKNWENQNVKTLDDVILEKKKEKEVKPKIEIFDYDWLDDDENT